MRIVTTGEEDRVAKELLSEVLDRTYEAGKHGDDPTYEDYPDEGAIWEALLKIIGAET